MSFKKNSTGRGKDRPRGILLRRGQVDPGRETPRTPVLSGLGPGGTVPPAGTAAPQRRTSPQAAPFNWVGIHSPVSDQQPKHIGSTASGFFTPIVGNSLSMRVELRTCWGAMLPGRASQLDRPTFRGCSSSNQILTLLLW